MLKKIKKVLKYKKSFENIGSSINKDYNLKVLVINSGYFLIKEVSRAFVESGDKVRLLDLYDSTPTSPFFKSIDRHAKDNFLEDLLNNLIQFKPDVIFTVNMIGFDIEGKLSGILDDLDVVVINWFVDTPMGILDKSEGLDKKNFLSFTWEKDYIKEFNKNFYKHKIEYLPYGTMYSGREVFKEERKFTNDISFIGNSMFYTASDWENRYLESIQNSEFKLKQEFFKLKESFITKFSDLENLDLNEKIIQFFKSNKILIDDNMLKTYFMFLGSNLVRKDLISHLDRNIISGMTIYGDENWQKLDLKNVKLETYLDYYKELPIANYNSKISLNLTSPQMRTGLNQRVYDTCASGGFLITDYREDFFELFNDFKYKNDFVFRSKD